jgi:hypothetical protein
MKNAMNVVPGEFVANGHDYRADLARFIREVYHLPCSEEQLTRVEAALRQFELVRQEKFDQTAAEADVQEPIADEAGGRVSHIEDHRAAA